MKVDVARFYAITTAKRLRQTLPVISGDYLAINGLLDTECPLPQTLIPADDAKIRWRFRP